MERQLVVWSRRGCVLSLLQFIIRYSRLVVASSSESTLIRREQADRAYASMSDAVTAAHIPLLKLEGMEDANKTVTAELFEHDGAQAETSVYAAQDMKVDFHSKVKGASGMSFTVCASVGEVCHCSDGIAVYGSKGEGPQLRVADAVQCVPSAFGIAEESNSTESHCRCYSMEWCEQFKDGTQVDDLPHRRRQSTGTQGLGLYQRRRWCGWGSVDCIWGMWGEWGACVSQSGCGHGRKKRRRSQILAAVNGGLCGDASEMYHTCATSNPPCPTPNPTPFPTPWPTRSPTSIPTPMPTAAQPTPRPTPTPTDVPLKYYTLAGCPKQLSNKKFPLECTSKYDVADEERCIKVDGTKVKMSVYGCNANVNWQAAAASCAQHGLRLPTKAEVESQILCGTGCGYDKRRIWTSTPCYSV